MKCLVTGGTGLVGSNLALTLLNSGHEVAITGHEAEQTLPGFTGKFLQPSFLGLDWEEIGSFDVLFHQAAINDTRFMDRKEMMRANFEASRRLFDHVVERGCRRIVYASSTAVYGRCPAPYHEAGPFDLNTPYAESKMRLEEFAADLARANPEVTVVGLRYCNIYGPGESHKGRRATMIYQFAQQMRGGNPRLFEFGEQRRDYIYVKDVVRANLLAAQASASGVVNCGAGEAVPFNRIVELLNDVLDLDRQAEYIPNPFAGDYQDYTQCDMSLAKELLGFVPEYSVESGIRDYHGTGLL